MASELNINSNYVGEVAGEIIGRMIKEANTISQNLVTVLPNVSAPVFVRKVDAADGFVDYACGWNPTGTVDFDERELVPKKIMWPYELCKEDFRQVWTQAQMGFSSWNDNIPRDEEAAMLMQMGKVIARYVDNVIWNGEDGDGEWEGFIRKIKDDPDTIGVPGAVPITPDNVEDQLGALIDLIPDAVLNQDGQVILVATNVIRALRRKYGSQARGNGIFLQPDEFSFEGYTITEGKSLVPSDMVAYNRNNLFFGTGLLSDHNEIRIKDMDEVDFTGQLRVKTVLNGGCQYAWSEEIVLYSTTT